MAVLKSFNPHEMSAETVVAVATGREQPLDRILSIVRDNLDAEQLQHVIVSAPRGYGKSFFLRYVEVKIIELAEKESLPVAMALLPEELPHVKEPDTLIAEIARVFTRAPADTVQVRWTEDDGDAWDEAVVRLDAAVAERFGNGRGLLVAGVENFDLLLKKAFGKNVQAQRLRRFLGRPGNRVMLITASARGAFDRDYDRPLFKAFEEIALQPWSIPECLDFFAAQRAQGTKPPLTEAQSARARAVATFISGTPRLATMIGEALIDDDTSRAADLLEKLVDELTPYYKERIEALPSRSQALLDALLRGGENCSATELARRVNAPSQSAIAAPLDDLRKDLVVTGDKAPDSAEVLLRVTDRVFAHYYRKRILSHGIETCPLEALVDLLAVIYSPEEKKREADKFAALGLMREAAVMERLWQTDQTRLDKELLGTAGIRTAFDTHVATWDRLKNEGRYKDGLASLEAALTMARTDGDVRREASVLRRRAWTFGQLGRHVEAVTTAREAVTKAEQVGDTKGMAVALRNAVWSLAQLDRHDEAIAIAREAVAKAEQAGDTREMAWAMGTTGWILGECGRHDEAITFARDAAISAEQVGDTRVIAMALSDAAWSMGQVGRHDEALASAHAAAAKAEQANDTGEIARALRSAAWNLGRLGRHDEAIATARDAAAKAEQAGATWEMAAALREAAWNLGRLGRHDEAVATARDAAAKAEQAGDSDEQVEIARTVLTIPAERTDVELACEAYGRLLRHAGIVERADPVVYFDDIARIATTGRIWPRLAGAMAGYPDIAEKIASRDKTVGAAGGEIASATLRSKRDSGLAMTRHLVASLAEAVEQADDPRLVRLWTAVLDAAATAFATRAADADFLRDAADIFSTHPRVPARAAALLAAAAAYHAAGRDPAALARLEPDLATTLTTLFPPTAPASEAPKPREKRIKKRKA
jgi:tetratricopeptide (TPR) repeat protein